jgi:Mg2+ and Co2+ transporter CorA
MLDSLTSTFLERVSFEVALTSERSNTVQKKFNAIGTIMLPLLVTQGLFTMNVKVVVLSRSLQYLLAYVKLC